MVTGRHAPSPAPDDSGLLARLLAVVRPEFRVDILVPGPGALLFNAEPCPVAGCRRMPWTRKLCRGHYYRWKQDGCPDVEVFAASTCPDLLGRKELTECVVAGCRFGGARRGLCVRHHGFWERAGKPDRPAWLASLPAVADEGHAVCTLSFCTLWRQGNSPFCVNHKSRWEFAGRPDIGEFTVICQSKGDDRFDFRPLAGRRQLKLELQYALQCRHDERHVNTTSGTVRRTITLAAASSITSLLDWPTQRWAAFFDENLNARHDQNGQLAFLRYAHAHVEDLQVGTGWEAEFPRDVGAAAAGDRGPGAPAVRSHPQQWLRELAKRFARWRLSIGRSVNQVIIDLLALTRFAPVSWPGPMSPQPASLTSAGRCWNAIWPISLPIPGRPLPQPGHRLAQHLLLCRPAARVGQNPGQRDVLPRRPPQAPSAFPAGWPSASWRKSNSPPTWTGGATPKGGCSP